MDEVPEKITYEDVLHLVGDFGRWQLKIILLLWVPMFFCGTQFVTTDFMGYEPKQLYCDNYKDICEADLGNIFIPHEEGKSEHMFKIFPEYSTYFDPMSNSKMSQAMTIAEPFCKTYVPWKVDGACDWNKTTDTTPIRECDKSSPVTFFMHGNVKPVDKKTSVVTEFTLVCGNYWMRLVWWMFSGAGSSIGSILIAVMADKAGRRPAMLLSMVTMALGAVFESFARDIWLLCACTFLNSFGKWALFQIILVYMMESLGFQRRLPYFSWISYNSLVTITFFIPYCLGKMAATAVVQETGNWREFELWVAVASCSQLLILLFIPESPRWLLFRHKLARAGDTLRAIARTNGVSEELTLAEGGGGVLITCPKGRGTIITSRHSAREMCSPTTLRYSLALGFGWPMISFLRFGLNDVNQIFENPYHTNYIRGGLEITGLLLTVVVEGIVGRRSLLLALLSSTSLAFFAISFTTMPMNIKKNLVWFSNMPTTSANTLIVLFTLCAYPTSLSSIVIGIFTALSCIGEILAPVLLDYLPYITTDQDVAFFAMGFVAFIGTSLCYYLPEVLGRPLPETLHHVVFFARRRPGCCGPVDHQGLPERRRPLSLAPSTHQPPV